MRTVCRPLVTLLVLVCAVGPFLLAAEAQRPDEAQTRVPRETVYRGEDISIDWGFEELWHIGGGPDEDLSLVLLQNHQLDADAHGNTYLLDVGGPAVLVISPTGTIQNVFAPGGRGPGELRDPGSLNVQADTLNVYDLGQGRVVRWKVPELELLDPIQLPVPIFGPLQVLPSGIAHQGRKTVREGLWRKTLVRRQAGGTQEVFVGIEFDRLTSTFPECGWQMRAPRIFEPPLVWTARGDTLAVARQDESVVEVHGPSGLSRVFGRELPLRRVTEDMARREVAEGWTMGGCTEPAESVVDLRRYAEVLPPVMGLTTSPDGEYWVLRGHVSDEPGVIDVYSAGGDYRGTLPPGAPFPDAFLGRNRIVSISTDEFDVPVITAFRIRR